MPADNSEVPRTIQLPAPTAWPMVFAFGLTLVAAGLATAASVSVVGAAVALAGAVGWFANVLPREAHETVAVEPPVPAPTTSRPVVTRLQLAPDLPRAVLPLATYPVSAGLKGGLAGSVAMAALAVLYGVLSGHGVFYPINLLAAGFLPASMTESTAQMEAFQPGAFALAVAIHLTTSVVVGLLYGAMLPMLPTRPILLGGVLAPLVWSGLLHGILGIINPVLDARVQWGWFVLSQVGFGLVAGVVVSRQQRIPVVQGMSLAVRAGLETPGMMREGPHPKGKTP